MSYNPSRSLGFPFCFWFGHSINFSFDSFVMKQMYHFLCVVALWLTSNWGVLQELERGSKIKKNARCPSDERCLADQTVSCNWRHSAMLISNLNWHVLTNEILGQMTRAFHCPNFYDGVFHDTRPENATANNALLWRMASPCQPQASRQRYHDYSYVGRHPDPLWQFKLHSCRGREKISRVVG